MAEEVRERVQLNVSGEKLAAGHFGLGHGNEGHAPDEYYLIESSHPRVQGIDGVVRSFVDFLFAIAASG